MENKSSILLYQYYLSNINVTIAAAYSWKKKISDRKMFSVYRTRLIINYYICQVCINIICIDQIDWLKKKKNTSIRVSKNVKLKL